MDNMFFQKLIKEAKKHPFDNQLDIPLSSKTFTNGALWMHSKMLSLLDIKRNSFPKHTHFEFYGYMKYILSSLGFIISIFLFASVSYFLIPLSILVFYFIEVHFLFLFPLLIHQHKRPVCTSIKMTYKVGILKVMLNTLCIGVFMLYGLLHIKKPLQNWYIGCYSILIWYQDEVVEN